EIATTRSDLFCLCHASGGELDSRAYCKTVALNSGELKADPMISGYPPVAKNQRGAIDVFDNNVQLAVIEQVTNCKPAGNMRLHQRRSSLLACVAKASVTLIQMKKARLFVTSARRQLRDLWVYVTGDCNEIEPTIIIGVKKGVAPFHQGHGWKAYARLVGHIVKLPISIVAIQRVVLVFEVADIDGGQAIVQIVTDCDTHARLLRAV